MRFYCLSAKNLDTLFSRPVFEPPGCSRALDSFTSVRITIGGLLTAVFLFGFSCASKCGVDSAAGKEGEEMVDEVGV